MRLPEFKSNSVCPSSPLYCRLSNPLHPYHFKIGVKVLHLKSIFWLSNAHPLHTKWKYVYMGHIYHRGSQYGLCCRAMLSLPKYKIKYQFWNAVHCNLHYFKQTVATVTWCMWMYKLLTATCQTYKLECLIFQVLSGASHQVQNTLPPYDPLHDKAIFFFVNSRTDGGEKHWHTWT